MFSARTNPSVRPDLQASHPTGSWRSAFAGLWVILTPFLSGCGLFTPTLHVAEVDEVARPNGILELNTMWAGARPLEVVLTQVGSGGLKRIPVRLRAVHDRRAISFLVQWADASESEERVQWIWNRDTSQYTLRRTPTDMFAIQFPLQGGREVCMMTGKPGVADVWQWRGGWTRFSGYADDQTMHITREPPPGGEARIYPLRGDGGESVYIRWQSDEGRLPWEVVESPIGRKGAVVHAISPQPPSGSAADVLAEELYEGAAWNIEIWRLLVTGFNDDYQIRGPGPHLFAVAVGQDEEGSAHYTSGPLHLKLD